MVQMISVSSSNIAAVGYDSASKKLYVEFKKGSTYIYNGVSERVYNELVNADSVGRYFAQNVKNNYAYTKL